MNTKLLDAMIAYYSGDPARSQHFMKVYAYAKLIGLEEGLDPRTQHILETAAIVHDIGIKASEEIHGKGICDGKKQEKYGPPIAAQMLRELGEPEDVVERVAFLVSRHHTFEGVDGPDWQILLEADYVVNAYEEGASESAIRTTLVKVFKTSAGKKLLSAVFAL